tara:strand:- start:647 stop:2725 length:2079 start_codon:yes stop_codon:yes gene_type:complete
MSKYQDTLMLADAAKRKKDELMDSAGMELIQAGLGSGRLHKFGHKLAGRVIGKRALRHTTGAIKDAVAVYKKRGSLADVVRHFATKKGGLGARAVRALDPTGRIAKLHADIRNTYGSAEEAANALGAEHEATIRQAYETARAGPQSALKAGQDQATKLAKAAQDKATKLAQDAQDKADQLTKDAREKADKVAQDAQAKLDDAKAKASKAVGDAKEKAEKLAQEAQAKLDDAKAKVEDAKGMAGGAVEGAKEKARRLKVEAEAGAAAGAAKVKGAVKSATGAGSTVLSQSAAGAEEAAKRLRVTAGNTIQDERAGKQARLLQKRTEEARVVAQRMKDASDLKAKLLKDRQASLKKKPVEEEAVAEQPEAEAEPAKRAVADNDLLYGGGGLWDEDDLDEAPAPAVAPAVAPAPAPAVAPAPAAAPVPRQPDTTESSVKRSTGLGGFLNSPEEEAKLQRLQPRTPVKVAFSKSDPFSVKAPQRKPRPSFRNPAIRRRPQAGETGYIDPVQARLAKHAEVSRNLASAKANLEASRATQTVESKTSSWSIRRPPKSGRQERANPTTIRNSELDSQDARSTTRTVAEGPSSLPSFEEASQRVAKAPQSLIQSLRRQVMGNQAKPPPRASTAFAPESALIQRARARNSFLSQPTQGEGDDRPQEEEEYTTPVKPEENFSFASFGFGGGDMERSTVIGEI